MEETVVKDAFPLPQAMPQQMQILFLNCKSQLLFRFSYCRGKRRTAMRNMSGGGDIIAVWPGILLMAALLQHLEPSVRCCTGNPGMYGRVRTSIQMRNAAFLHKSGGGSIPVHNIKKFQSFAVQNGFRQDTVTVVGQLQREERVIFIDQAEENLIPLPQVQIPDIILRNPLQNAFVARNRFSGEAVRRV